MRFIEKLKVIERVDGLIRRKATGTADELSTKLGVSRRTVYEIINLMKEMDAPINYCPNRKSFYYRYECDLVIGFMSNENIKGGKTNKYMRFNHFEGLDLYEHLFHRV